MCGIAGILDPRLVSQHDALRAVGTAMGDAISHRGPDASNVWCDVDRGLALAHRRLSIVDLSEGGGQPIISADGRWVLVYNGELYNTEDMRGHPALAQVAWRGHSDTEVLLESIANRGLHVALGDANGMFAFALFDRKLRTLQLVRDRVGIKPLFYHRRAGVFAFGSELKAFAAANIQLHVDPRAVTSFLRLAYVPGEHCIFDSVKKVAPGEIVTLDEGLQVHRETYWHLPDLAQACMDAPLALSDKAATDQLEALLQDAVSRQTIADVKLGAFLSGGVDSSLVVAMMAKASTQQVRTFSIGFPDFGWNEAPYAKAVAEHLGTDHTELMMSAREALDTIPRLAAVYDEPFGDSSQIPTLLVSKLARRSVSVALSGDGGDELFAGYNRHLFAATRWPSLSRYPLAARQALAGLLRGIPAPLFNLLQGPLQAVGAPPQLADKLQKVAGVLGLAQRDVHRTLASVIQSPDRYSAAAEYEAFSAPSAHASLMQAMQLQDMMSYLPDDILQKVDRASMAVSLEVRPPLLDHRLIEFAWRLPQEQLIREGQGKWLLRQVLYRHVPKQLIERPKMGFGVPLADWLRGPLRSWAGDLIHSVDFSGGLLDKAAAAQTLQAHLDGKSNHAYALWNLLMYEAWRQRWVATH